MKLFLFIAALLTGVVTALGYPENPSHEVIEKYNRKLENSLKLPTDFAGHFIVDESSIQMLKGKIIYHVELIYTRYKSSSDFDQDALNNRRVSQLKSKLPQVISDNPTWSFVEQTGAVTKETAQTYYHGFVIHYSDKMDYQTMSTYFEDMSKSFTSYQVDNSQQQELKYTSGTIIHIEPNSVTYANGKPVSGNYDLEYREFRNPAEIALSGIPMTIIENGEELHFSSVGMYEIKAYQNGEELFLKKPIEVDFKCTDAKEGVSFYQMNNEGEWKTIKPISFSGESDEVAENQIADTPVGNIQPIEASNQDYSNITQWSTNWSTGDKNNNVNITTTQKGKFDESLLNDYTWQLYLQRKKSNPELFSNIVIKEIPAGQRLQIKSGNHMQLLGGVIGMDFSTIGTVDGGYQVDSKYSTVVSGLSSSGFGVYNCDQTFRIQNRVALAPTYLNATDSTEISNKFMACLIDLNYNGSFSYHPNNIVCNSQGRNVLLLFTNDKKVFMYSENDFASLDKSNSGVILSMKDVTEQIKSPDDLRKLLNI